MVPYSRYDFLIRCLLVIFILSLRSTGEDCSLNNFELQIALPVGPNQTYICPI